MLKKYIGLCSICFCSPLFAQQTGEITGQLKNKQNQPVEFANLVLLKSSDSSLVKGGMSDERGIFTFDQVTAGNYLLLASMIGYQKYAQPFSFEGNTMHLPEIILENGVVNLAEANIVGLKPLIEHHIDKTVVNVENTTINSGSSALEILKRSPGVTVDQNDKVSLRGKQDVLILIDNRPSYLTAEDLANMLKTMPSDDISKIEIMTNPSSKYEASGNAGIINIRLRKKQNMGLNGSLYARYGQGVYPDFGSGLSLNYRQKKINVYGNYNYTHSFSYEINTLYRRFSGDSSRSVFDQQTHDNSVEREHHAKAGIDYFINNKHTLGFFARGDFDQTTDKTISTTLIKNNSEKADSGYTTINRNNGHWNTYSFNLNHQFVMDSTGRELTTDFDFASYHNLNNFNFKTNYFSSLPGYVPYTEIERNNQPSVITIESAKMDYTQSVLKKLKLEAGLKGSSVTTDNDLQYFITENNVETADTLRTNHFKYKEQILAAYSSLQGKFGKWVLQAGLRVEQTQAKGEQFTTADNFERNYVQLFPSAFVTYQLNAKNQFGLNYSRRIDRPEYQKLNPFRHFIDPRTFEQGNPGLQPQLTHSVEGSYTFMDAFSLTLNYSSTTDAITDVSAQIDSSRITYVTSKNLQANNNYSLTLNLPYQITKWWLTSNNLVFFNTCFIGEIDGNHFNRQLTSYLLNTYNSFSVGKGWTFELSAYYNSKLIWATFLIDPQYSVSGGIGKSFLNNRLNLKIALNDIFKTENTSAHINYNNINFDFHQQEDSQFVRFHLTWNFGKKTVAESRKRRLSSEEEQNRVKTGK